MKRILIFCYLVLFVAVIISGTLHYEERPLLIIISSNVIFGLVAITILMYGLSYKPKRFVWFWKIVPIVLVAYFISLRYLAGPSYVGTKGSLGSLLLLILAIIASFFPAFYLSFKFGYSKTLPAGKSSPKFIAFIFVITSLCVASRYFPLNKDRINIKVNYVAEYNKITKPANYDPNENAAPYYNKAFENLADIPEAIKDNWKDWPADMDDAKLNVLKSWLASNSQAFSYLKRGVQKPFCWIERHGTDNAIFNIELPEISKLRTAAWGLSLRAKLNALQGQIELAFTQVIELHKMGLHYAGPVTLVEQLVGIAINAIAFNTAFVILDRAEVDSAILANFQSQLEQQLQQSKRLNFSIGERIYGLDIAQRMFTDDGSGDGQLIPAILLKYKKEQPMVSSISYVKAILVCLRHPGRRETLTLHKKLYEELDKIVYKTPWQLRQNGTSYQDHVQKLTKGNYFLNDPVNALGRVCEIFQRGKTSGEALATTLALLRYKAEKGQLPGNLDQLVSAGYLEESPIDPFSDAPLVYKQIDNDFTLYSLGADFDDDGGVRSKWGEGEEGGDQVFWPVSRKQE